MKILFAASECAPFIKTGGLGDVTSALAKELCRFPENEVAIVLPLYGSIKFGGEIRDEKAVSFELSLGWRQLYCGVHKLKSSSRKNLTYYFIDNEYYFNASPIYGRFDDGERFAFFSKAICEMMKAVNFFPDIVHLNDWQTALVPLYLKGNYSDDDRYSKIKTVFTIHNIEYQGKASNGFLGDVIDLPEYWRETLTHNGCINFMKSAIVLSDSITTVSNTYSYEIRHAYFAHGLENLLQLNAAKLEGIINGIDDAQNDPRSDENLYENYGPGELSGKAANKVRLQKELGLEALADVPLFAVVSRLVAHKGMELLKFVEDELCELPIQLVILGVGEERFEQAFLELAQRYPEKVSVTIGFDSVMASKIYAAADFLLMPSKSEPCGLAQMIAMRYGAIPVVRETGGLFDTVPAINTERLSGRGITFKLFNAHDMLGAVKRASDFYKDKERLCAIVSKIMKEDFSWRLPAGRYMELYQSLK